jgi:hypothetical protein
MPDKEWIDARNSTLQEVFLQLKELLSSKRGDDVFIEILIGSLADAAKIKSFVAFSGCRADAEKREGHYLVRITGTPCCV